MLGISHFNENRNQGVHQVSCAVHSLDRVTVLTDSIVESIESIIFDTTGSVRATGVRLANGTEHTAKKEVILCAGAYKSS